MDGKGLHQRINETFQNEIGTAGPSQEQAIRYVVVILVCRNSGSETGY